jgi:hypothetical protein
MRYSDWTLRMSFEQLKHEVAALSSREQAELISYTLQLRHANDVNCHLSKLL